MSALSDYLRKPKSSLARSLNSRDKTLRDREHEIEEQSARTSHIVKTASRFGGAVLTAPAVAGAVGFAETRLPNKDGSPASLGPIPLSGIVGGALGVGALFASDHPIVADQIAFAGAGCMGLAAGSMGRAAGVKSRAKKLAKKNKGKKKLSPKKPPKAVAGYDDYEDDYEDVPMVAGSDVGHLEDEWSPEERELMGFA